MLFRNLIPFFFSDNLLISHVAQKVLRDLKTKISSQSKKNFVLEKDVRYLDSRIALLIQNRMALEEVDYFFLTWHFRPVRFADGIFQRDEMASHLHDATDLAEGQFPNDEKTQKYGNLLFLLQSEPRYIAHLCRLVSMAEIDSLLQTVMFTIYGNQYESREEHLLLTMFQVGLLVFSNPWDYFTNVMLCSLFSHINSTTHLNIPPSYVRTRRFHA